MMEKGNYSESMEDASKVTQPVISALFPNVGSAQGAIRELRDIGIRAESISVISRDEDRQDGAGVSEAGVAREQIEDEGLAYRAAEELPNDEELPTTDAAMIGSPMPVVTDVEVPPDEPLGGSERLGLSRDSDEIRRNEAETNADEDIYTDFPDAPGGINPNSPEAGRAGSDVQEAVKTSTGAAGNAAVGAGLGGVAGLLAGLAALAIPGVGPFIAAGPLAVALGGIIAGGATGGVVGALSTIGVPEEYARDYAAQIQQGQTLVSVRTDELTHDAVERVLTANGGQNIR